MPYIKDLLGPEMVAKIKARVGSLADAGGAFMGFMAFGADERQNTAIGQKLASRATLYDLEQMANT